MDCLALHDIELWTRIGVPEAEREQPQRLTASVTMQMDLRSVGVSDDMKDTTNYADIAKQIQELAKTQRKTIERLAEDIATIVLAHTLIQSVTVEIRKFPIPGVASVTCTITRP